MTKKTNLFSIGASVSPFLLLIYIIGFTSTLFFFNVASIANIPSAIGASIFFLFAFLAPIAIPKAFGLIEISDLEGKDFKKSAFFMTGAFLIMGLFHYVSQINNNFAIFTLQQNTFLASATATAPAFLQWFLVGITAPLAEELLFAVLAITIMALVAGVADNYISRDKSKVVGFWVSTVLTSLLFASFHIGSITIIGFFIAAVIFRALMIFVLFADDTFGGSLKKLFSPVGISTVSGFHIGNNIFSLGFGNSISILSSSGIVGAGVFIVAGLIIFGALLYVVDLVRG